MLISATSPSEMNLSQIRTKLQQRFNSLSLIRPTGRKILAGFLFLFVLFYFILPLLKSSGHRYIVLTRIERCLEDRLKPYANKVESQNAFIYHVPPMQDKEEKYFLPYIGNGYIGMSMDGKHGVWLKGERGLDIATDYNPLMQFEVKNYDIKDAVVLDITDGKIVKHTCFQKHKSALSSCVSLTQTLYIHRTRPGLLMQQISFYNPTDDHIEVDITQDTLTSWATEHKTLENMKEQTRSDADSATQWQIGSKTLANQVLLTVASRQFSQSGILELPAKSTVTRHSLSVFDYTVMESQTGEIDKAVTMKTILDRRSHTAKALRGILTTASSELFTEHQKAWHELWETGFSISGSKAPDSLNSDVINSTLYYILSHVSSPLQDRTSNRQEKKTATHFLNRPEACYHNKHHTLQFSSLWQIGDTVETMNKGVDTHLSSLGHYGCSNYIKAGAEGVLQAVLLSLGGFSFRTSEDKIVHMEFNVDPADLHRDYQFTNIRYGDEALLNISVIVDESNYAVLHVSSSTKGFLATDAALSDPVKLSHETVTLPVILTKPLTSILYVSNDRQHLMDMKKVVHHVGKPMLAPAHDHRLLALHKHGHSYGGLPVIFWILLVVLILVFHFFLFKMIFAEFCKTEGLGYRRRAFS